MVTSLINVPSEIVSGLITSVIFLFVLSRVRPRIQLSESVCRWEEPGSGLVHYSINIRNLSITQLNDLHVKAALIPIYDPNHPRVGKGTKLEFEYPTLFDLARRELPGGVGRRSRWPVEGRYQRSSGAGQAFGDTPSKRGSARKTRYGSSLRRVVWKCSGRPPDQTFASKPGSAKARKSPDTTTRSWPRSSLGDLTGATPGTLSSPHSGDSLSRV